MEKLTIHRALSELKLIGTKIEKGIENLMPSGLAQKDKLVNNVHQRDSFEKNAKETYQSIIDLIERRNKIKSAIVQANGKTQVTIAGNQMTIADAINLKAVIGYKKALIERMTKWHNSTKAQLEKVNAQVDADALKLAEVALGKQGIKIGDDDVQKVTSQFLEAKRFSIVDPIKVEEKISAMDKEIGDFEAEVDAVLSEINAVTVVEF